MDRIFSGRCIAVVASVTALVFPCVEHASTIYVLTADKRLLRYDSASPGTVTGEHPITGVPGSADLRAIDCRPGTGELYLFTTEGSIARLFTLDPLSGAATLAATLDSGVSGIAFGFDFNPVDGWIRVVSNLEQNLLVDPATGSVTVGTPLAYETGDPGIGANPCLEGAAFTNQSSGGTTTLYGIDTSTNTLVTLPSPANGMMHTVGPLGADAAYDFAGFDIAADGTAFAAFALVGTHQSGLYTVDLSTGAVSLVGSLGGVTTQAPVVGMTVACGATTHVTAAAIHAARDHRGIAIRWRTATEIDTLGFNVYREIRGRRVRITGARIAALGFGLAVGRLYSFVDRRPPVGAARYWVEALALDGSRTWLGPAVVQGR